MDNSDIAKKLGKAGGLATSKKYGKKHYKKLAENMNRKRAEAKLLKNTPLTT